VNYKLITDYKAGFSANFAEKMLNFQLAKGKTGENRIKSDLRGNEGDLRGLKIG